MKIRKLREDDIGDIVAMIHDVMGPDDAKKALQDMKISLGEHAPYKFEEFYVVEVNNKLLGAGGFWSLKYDPNIARLDWFVVRRSEQRKGIGTLLIKFLESRLKKQRIKMILAETSSGNDYKAAVNFYMKNGFRLVSQIPGYWEDKTDWLYFAKRLGK